MSTHGSVAGRVRRRKELKPADYCPDPRCLWNVKSSGPCPHHQPVQHALMLNDRERQILEALKPFEGDRKRIARILRAAMIIHGLDIEELR